MFTNQFFYEILRSKTCRLFCVPVFVVKNPNKIKSSILKNNINSKFRPKVIYTLFTLPLARIEGKINGVFKVVGQSSWITRILRAQILEIDK